MQYKILSVHTRYKLEVNDLISPKTIDTWQLVASQKEEVIVSWNFLVWIKYLMTNINTRKINGQGKVWENAYVQYALESNLLG